MPQSPSSPKKDETPSSDGNQTSQNDVTVKYMSQSGNLLIKVFQVTKLINQGITQPGIDSVFSFFQDNILIGYSSKVYLFSMQGASSLVEILDFTMIPQIIEDLKYDIYPDANDIAESLLVLSKMEVTKITEEEICLNIWLRPQYQHRLLFISKEGFDLQRKYTVSLDIS